MALLISNAILHTVGYEDFQNRYSDVELDIDSEACGEFIGKHVRRLLNNAGAKNAVFKAESQVYTLVKSFQKDEIHFKDFSRQLCGKLAAVMRGNDDIAPADVLVTFFDNGNKSYIAMIKLNYGECFTHKLTQDEDGKTENQIVKNLVVLPMSASKVEEACLIPYDPMVLRIMEKPHMIGGESVDYFSKLFLECETEMSQKEKVEAIQEIVDEITVKFFDGSVEMAARVKTALVQEADSIEENDGLVLEDVVRRAYGGNEKIEDIKSDFISLSKEYGLSHQVSLDKAFVQREFKVQRYKAENGVELKFPSELVEDPDQIQMLVNPDGSVSITFKNLRPAGL
jgi:nucleoid-associated protein YejK